jgi:hypothetical protein
MDIRSKSSKTVTPIRLQAYERVALFLERINPNSLVMRMHKPGMSARQLQSDLLQIVRAEFEHNMAQQIYMSPAAWKAIRAAKEETIKILLHGLTGPVEGVTYNEMMPPMGNNDDEWIASVLSYLRYDLGLTSVAFNGPVNPNMAERILVKPEEVKKIREETAGRTKPYTWEELNAESSSTSN